VVDILCLSIFAHSHLFSKLTCLQKTEHTQSRKWKRKANVWVLWKISTDYWGTTYFWDSG